MPLVLCSSTCFRIPSCLFVDQGLGVIKDICPETPDKQGYMPFSNGFHCIPRYVVDTDRLGPSHSTGIYQRLREITQQVLIDATLLQVVIDLLLFPYSMRIDASSSRLRLLRLRLPVVFPQSISLVSSRYPLSSL